MELNVNTDSVVKFTNNLEKLHKSAFPVAVRQTLNDAAFDMKKDTLQKSTAKKFTVRKKAFFKRFSRVEPAKGFDLKTMQSTVGFTGKDQAVKDLEDQEQGGTIPYREYIPMTSARIGEVKTRSRSKKQQSRKNIRKNARLSEIREGRLIDARLLSGNNGDKFHEAVKKAGKKGHVIADYKDKTFLWRINSLKRTKSGSYKLTPLYSLVNNRKVKVTATGFMKLAAEDATKNMEDLYINRAKKRIERELAK